MSAPFDSVLLTGFGGPTPGCCRRHDECPGEAYCYVENVVGGRTGGAGRIREVAAHYARFGGFSPFSHFSQKQAGALETYLAAAGSPMPVYVGFRFWTPYIREALAEMGRRGLRRALGVVLAPHRAKVSWEAYQGSARAAREEVGEGAPEVEFLETGWFDHPAFIEAIAGNVRRAAGEMGPARFGAARLIFTAHSIPVTMAKVSPYREEFLRTAELAAEAVGAARYDVGFQSSPEVPPGAWLEPDVTEVVRKAAGEGVRDVLLAPAGFICDHVEVLYDLDVEAREAAEGAGLGYFRAPTVGTHPSFIAMLRDLVLARAGGRIA
ncbi:MAG: ferrochelatase [Candidatus Tectomicrobia bacterium RIFCSPLOWO2_12_FULL_69_37]|nr:MAG: ferrochelatase [Candidatus Tectomicrobia bacterium RIFCSPLOWO2_12_FULL_69_37]